MSHPFHPALLALFPVLFLYGHNANQVSPSDALPLLLGAPAVAVIAFGGLARILRSAPRAAIITSLATLLFFTYGHVFRLADDQVIGDARIDADSILLPIWGGLIFAVIVIGLKVAEPARFTRGSNLAAIVLVLTAGVSVATTEIPSAFSSGATPPVEVGGEPGVKETPDIYYIVLDRYAGGRTLSRTFGFDNEPFLSWLEQRGFYVARESNANYPDTAHSLASTFSLRYLEGRGSGRRDDWGPLYDRIRRSTVAATLKERGYSYVVVGSWWEPTRTSPLADRVLSGGSSSEFTQLVLDSTLLRPIGKLAGADDRWDARKRGWRRTHEQFIELATFAGPGPTFLFAHVLAPHYPFVFDESGGFVTREEEMKLSWEENYVRQVRFVNEQLMTLVETLLARDDPPVIILQADEGAHPLQAEQDEGFRWSQATREQLDQKFPILNAVYLPAGDHAGLHPRISPVNQFRFLLGRLFGADLPLLPDESYVFAGPDRLYDFTRVTPPPP